MARSGPITAALVLFAGAIARAGAPPPEGDPCQRAREALGDAAVEGLSDGQCEQALDAAEEERWQLWLDAAAADELAARHARAALALARFVEAVERRTTRVPAQWVVARDRARDTLARLDGQLLRTMARVRIDSRPSGAEATFAPEVAADLPARAPRTPVTAYFAPGAHRVQLADRASDRTREVVFTVTAGRTLDLRVDLTGEVPPEEAILEAPGAPVLGRSPSVNPEEEPGPAVGVGAPEVAPPESPSDAPAPVDPDDAPPIRAPSSALLPTVGTAAVALGTASLAIGVVFAMIGAGLDDEAACDGAACERHAKLRAEVESDADVAWTRATAALIAGGALVAGGVIALVLDDDAPATAVAPWLGPDGGGLTGAVRF